MTEQYIDEKLRVRRRIVLPTVNAPGSVVVSFVQGTNVYLLRHTDDTGEVVADDALDIINFSSDGIGNLVFIEIADTNRKKADYEIFASKDYGAYDYYTTIPAGGSTSVNGATFENAVMRFKARAKIGNFYSDFVESKLVNTAETISV